MQNYIENFEFNYLLLPIKEINSENIIFSTEEMPYEFYIPEIKKRYKDHITEEIADIMVMLKQFQVYFRINDKEINNIIDYKINRQIDRINHLPK